MMNPGSSEICGAVGARCDLCDPSRSQFSLLIVSLFKKKQKTDQTSDKKIKPAARRCDRTAVAAPHAVHLASRSLAHSLATLMTTKLMFQFLLLPRDGL